MTPHPQGPETECCTHLAVQPPVASLPVVSPCIIVMHTASCLDTGQSARKAVKPGHSELGNKSAQCVTRLWSESEEFLCWHSPLEVNFYQDYLGSAAARLTRAHDGLDVLRLVLALSITHPCTGITPVQAFQHLKTCITCHSTPHTAAEMHASGEWQWSVVPITCTCMGGQGTPR